MTDTTAKTYRCLNCAEEHPKGESCPEVVERVRRINAFHAYRPDLQHRDNARFVMMQTPDNHFEEWLERHPKLRAIYLASGPYMPLNKERRAAAKLAAE